MKLWLAWSQLKERPEETAGVLRLVIPSMIQRGVYVPAMIMGTSRCLTCVQCLADGRPM